MSASLVGSEMCIRDRGNALPGRSALPGCRRGTGVVRVCFGEAPAPGACAATSRSVPAVLSYTGPA
eukprot:845303-Alexandrium_andersonii.AAC.1